MGTNNVFKPFAQFIDQEDLTSGDVSDSLRSFLLDSRKKFAITQREFAESVGVSLRQIQRVESGESNVSLEILIAIMKGLSRYENSMRR